MSNPLTDIITGGFSGVMSSISDVLGHFITSPEERFQAQVKLTEIATNYQLAVLEADKEFAVQQATVITAEAKSESWIARNWRPVTMLVFVYIIAHNYIFATLFHLTVVPIPPDMWDLLKLGLGGYIAGRSVEKISDSVAAAVIAKKDK